MKRPKWVTKYSNIGLKKHWLDPVLEEYLNDFITKTSSKYCPFNFVKTDILNCESKFNIKNIDIPKDYKITYAIKFIYDTISTLSEFIPKKDKEIYDMYNNIQECDKFDCDYNFSDFYEFCRQIQYVNIKQTKSYKLINKAEEKYIYDDFPTKGSKWSVEYCNNLLKIEVIEPVIKISNDIIDPNMEAKIIDPNNSEFNVNDTIQIEPQKFNEGTLLSYGSAPHG
jgi:hypothetical protein